MTVIAFKNKIMACDSAHGAGTRIITLDTKIKHTMVGGLVGCCGDNDSRDLEKWLDHVTCGSMLPTRKQLMEVPGNQTALLALPDSTLWVIELDSDKSEKNASGCTRVTFPHFAIGCGGRCAMGALDFGATAQEAVEYACTRDLFCRPPVHTLELGKCPLMDYAPHPPPIQGAFGWP